MKNGHKNVNTIYQTCKKFCVVVTAALLMTATIGSSWSANNVLMSLPIAEGTVTISSPTSFAFDSTPASFITGIVTKDFTGVTNYFTVNDLKGSDTGYTTTLQIASDLVTGAYRISSGNVAFKADYPVAHLLSGTTNPRVITDSNATGGFQALNNARTFIYRNTALNTWVISQYGQHITMQITIPAGQPSGVYSGVLVYTLIEL